MMRFLIALAICFGMVLTLPTAAQSMLSFCIITMLIADEIYKYFRKKSNFDELFLKIGIFLSVVLFEIAKDSDFLFLFLGDFSLHLSGAVGKLIGKSISLAATYSGIELVITFLLVGFWVWVIYKNTSILFGMYALTNLGLWLVYIGVWSVLAENSIRFRLHLIEPLTGALDYRFLLLAFLSVSYMIFRRRFVCTRFRWELRFLEKIKKVEYILIVYLLLLVAMYPGFIGFANRKDHLSHEANSGAVVLFWDTNIDFELPSSHRYGLENVGMFGVLPRYLMMRGYECALVQNMDRSNLERADVLVIINPMRVPENGEVEAVSDFVREGGTVILAGDHTCYEEIREPINAILKDVGVELNFDSAIGFKSLWGGKYEKKGEITGDLPDFRIQIVVGASLNIDSRSTAIVKAREGYSDSGDIQNVSDGFLGDMRFNPGEQLGDLVLASETKYGSGRYFVFGDTSLFQNTVLPYSYPLIDRLFSKSRCGSDSEKRDSEKALAGETSPVTSERMRGSEFRHTKFRSECVVNGINLESISRDKSPDSIDGFLVNAMRAGIFPYVNYGVPIGDILKDEGVDLVVLVEPAISFSDEELKLLEDFMRKGGRVILCADYKSPEASKKIAEHFGFSFLKMPIGRIAPERNSSMAFWNACPILFEGENPGFDGDIQVLMSVWGYSAIVSKNIGNGELIVFGDADFLKNKNLEHIDSYREGNIDFLQNILKRVRRGE